MKKLLTLLFTLCFFSQVLAQIVWNSPTMISTSGNDASQNTIAIDSNGNATAAWVENGFVVSSSLPLGGSWSALTTLSGSSASTPLLGVDGSGNAIAVWLESGVVKSATLPFGGTWGTATSVSGSGASSPVLTVDSNGDAASAWVVGGTIQAAQKPSGSGWGTVSTLSTGGSTSNDHPNIAIGTNKTVVVVWHNVTSGSDQLQSSSATIGGAWGTALNVFQTLTSSLNQNFPKVAVDANGNATMLWFRSVGTGATATNVSVMFAQLPSGATAWSLPVQISDPTVSGFRDPATHLLMVGYDANGNTAAIWTQSEDGFTFDLLGSVKTVGQTSWLQPAGLQFQNVYGFNGNFSINSFGDAVAVFMFYDGTNLNISALESQFAGFVKNTWTSPSTPSTGTNNSFPVVASSFIGSTVNAVATWLQYNGTNTTLQAASGSRALLGPPSAPMLTQSTTNFGAFQDNMNTITWTASTDPNTTSYVVYRNGKIIGGTLANVLTFTDHNRGAGESDTYGVASLDNGGFQSVIVTVSTP